MTALHGNPMIMISVANNPASKNFLTTASLDAVLKDCYFESNLKYPGDSFRAKFLFKLKTNFYSGRDRAGKEKKAKDDKEKQSNKNQIDETPNNHLCRDWISGQPIAKAGGWKRLFRQLCKNIGSPQEELNKLFGVIDSEETLPKDLCGELKFHHTQFFIQQNNGRKPVEKKAKYLIAPRDPATGKVKGAIITYEVVPPGSLCELVIDYLPRHYNSGQGREVWQLLVKAANIVEEDAIGGKSTIFGKLELIDHESDPEFPKSGGDANNG